MRMIHWPPDELFKVTLRSLATTTPESLPALPPTSPLPDRVEINLYVASSLITSVMSPVTWPSLPTCVNQPRQVPVSLPATAAEDASDSVGLPAAPGLCVAQPGVSASRAVLTNSVTTLRWRILVLLFRKRLRPRECRVAVDVHLCGLVIRAAWGFLPAKEGHTLDQTGREKEGSGSRDVATQDWNDVRPRCPESLSAPADSGQPARNWRGVRRSGRTAADAGRARRGGDR